MPPVKAGLRPPPAAADGLDRGHFPASLATKRSTAQCGRQSSKRRANFFRAAIFARILTAIHNARHRAVAGASERIKIQIAIAPMMTNPAPTIECDGTELYVTFDGVRIAKRGRLKLAGCVAKTLKSGDAK
jgi:hypothetical protein